MRQSRAMGRLSQNHLFLWGLLVSLVLELGPSPSWAKTPGQIMGDLSGGDCTGICKRIPPLSESLLQKPVAPQVTSPSMDTFKVMIWNIFKGRKQAWPSEFQQWSSQADLILLQEVLLDEGLGNRFFNWSPFSWDMAVSFITVDDHPTGVLTARRGALSHMGLKRTVDREPGANTPKMTLISRIPWGQQQLLVVNIHGINFRKSDGLQRQLEQTQVELKMHQGPILFAGDFNTKTPMRIFMVDRFMGQFGLTRVAWPVDNRRTPFVLDHVYSRGLDLAKAYLAAEVAGSDHPLLWAEFQAPPQ